MKAHHTQDHKCCGVVEDTKYHVRAKRESRTKPQPWIVRKLLVFVTVGVIAYAGYVYIGRFCVPFIKGKDNRRVAGIILLIVFVVLYFWLLWGYTMVVFTSPGYAKHHINTAPQLQHLPPRMSPPHVSPKASDEIQLQAPTTENRSHRLENSISSSFGTQHTRTESIGGPSYEDILLRTKDRAGILSREHPEPNPGTSNALPQPATTATPAQRKLRKIFHPQSKEPRPKIYVARRPPMAAILLPENRYCTKDDIIKPYRAHHCRHCGTCVLKYDHHCPWIGQCVGARNHKYFVNMTLATGIFCIYVFSTVLAYTVRDTVINHANTDPQHIVLIALAGLFTLFSWTLTVSHIMLILKNQTTVEHMNIRHMEERESEQLAKAFACWDFRGKRLTRKEWDREWGKLDTEGHIWWMGDKREAWQDVMGKNVWGWFLPVGRGLTDGLSFPVNPRFDTEGRWRRRSEWPPEFQ